MDHGPTVPLADLDRLERAVLVAVLQLENIAACDSGEAPGTMVLADLVEECANELRDAVWPPSP